MTCPICLSPSRCSHSGIPDTLDVRGALDRARRHGTNPLDRLNAAHFAYRRAIARRHFWIGVLLVAVFAVAVLIAA